MSAAALMALDGLLADGWCVVDGLLGEAGARRLLAAAEATPLRDAGVSRAQHHDAALRGDALAWVDADSAVGREAAGALVPRLDALAAEIARESRLALAGAPQLQLARYPAGAGYVRHRDAFRPSLPAPTRRLTCVYYLNRDWGAGDGGALRLHPRGGAPVDVLPCGDRLALFYSEEMEHEVLPATRPRWALTAWYLSP